VSAAPNPAGARLPEPSLNVSTVFHGLPLEEGVIAAGELGFAAVEFWWPQPELHDAVVAAVAFAEVEVAMFTLDGGPDGPGLLVDPDRSEGLETSLAQAFDLAERLSCPRLYTLIGKRRLDLDGDRQRAILAENLGSIADAANARGIEILLEPINSADNGRQVIERVEDAAALVEELGRDNLGLIFDLFHVSHLERDPLAALERVRDRVRHIHLADFPGRVEPGRGTLDFAAFHDALLAGGYDVTVGLEWFGSDDPAAGLAAIGGAGFRVPAGERA
jgi:hydroxypyruvate isomerase